MASSNANSSRKTPTANSGNAETGVTPNTSKPPSTIKLKTKASKLDTSVNSSRDQSPNMANQSASPATAPKKATNAASTKQVADANKQQEQDESPTQRCKHCSKQIEKAHHPVHTKQCMRAKKEERRKEKEAKEAAERAKAAKEAKEKYGDVITEGNKATENKTDGKDASKDDGKDGEAQKGDKDKTATIKITKNAKKTAVELSKKQGKKRKADVNDSDAQPKPPTKKQKKKDAAVAAAATTTPGEGGANGEKQPAKPKPSGKPKGPVDVEKQCGVPLPNGGMCARSLTCKSHAMGAKRSVVGRSLPYDILLQNYQKKNQAKQQKAAMAANQPLPEDLAVDGLGVNGEPVNSDEEKDAVMAGIARAAPRPMFERASFSCKQRYGYGRMKEMLSNALGGNRGANLFSTSAATQGGGSYSVGGGGTGEGTNDGNRAGSLAAQGGSGKQNAGTQQAAHHDVSRKVSTSAAASASAA
ncbi:MAG: Dcp1p-Dcp2p decapping enzyme complex alpha subunit [Alyxoria varia]|nr:MAG: Dcp1p-Dcp2p decapping enzyme complex alpha subunit [Alyxoria varia]